jgi:5'-nucleotidase
MEKLLIDMDGVISEIYAQFVKYEQEDLRITQTALALNEKLENEAFRNLIISIC